MIIFDAHFPKKHCTLPKFLLISSMRVKHTSENELNGVLRSHILAERKCYEKRSTWEEKAGDLDANTWA